LLFGDAARKFLSNLNYPTDLLYVMQSVNEVELAPLWGRKWSEDRMIKKFCCSSKARLALRDHFVHPRNFRTDLNNHRFARRSTWSRSFGCGSSSRHVSDANYDESLYVVLPCRFPRERLVGGEYAAKPLCRSFVREVEMLQDLPRTPLSSTTDQHLFSRGISYCRRNFPL
jgi:hypothetical protein